MDDENDLIVMVAVMVFCEEHLVLKCSHLEVYIGGYIENI